MSIRARTRPAASGWDFPLTRPLQVRGGPRLVTLEDAGRFVMRLSPSDDQNRQAWIHATELVMAAAEGRGSIMSATDAVDGALFLQGMLELQKDKTARR